MTNLAYKLETKSAENDNDPLAEVKDALAGLTSDVEKKTAPVVDITKRLEEVEAKLARPAITGKATDEENLESKAINSFLRNGASALDDAEKKALNVGTGSAGGYAVAPEYSTTIIDKLTEFSPMRQVSSVIAIGSSKVYIPVNSAKLAGGWVTETGDRSESQPTFSQVEIDAYEHAVVVPISQQLLEDSFVDLQAYLAGQIATQFGKAEATAFVTGDGSGKPTGFLNTPTDYEAVEANQDGTDLLAKVIEAHYALAGTYAARGSWLMNRKTMGAIRAAADNAAKGTLWSDSLADGTPAMLLGRPVYDAPDMDDVASDLSGPPDTYPIAFGDFASAYQIVDRIGVQIMRDDFTGADNGIVKIRARRRVGGKPLLTEAVVLVSGVAS